MAMTPRRELVLRIALRATALIFGIVIIGVIEQNGYFKSASNDPVEPTQCVFGGTQNHPQGNSNACKFGLAVGILALIAAIVLSAVDVGGTVVEENGGATTMLIIVADLIASVIEGFLCLIAFAYLLDLWTKDSLPDIPSHSKSSARATIAFCFLSAIVWIVLVLLDTIRLRSLQARSAASEYDKI